MTKALRITSIAIAAATVLLVVLPAVFSSDMNEQTKTLLNSPGIIESLNKTATADAGAASPLVQQAEKFAAYLNPPKPPPKRERPTTNSKRRAPVRPTSPVTAKFELLGTSYYPLRPELSLALIDEPGAGLRWVRQSSKIGHLTVEQVKDGKVVIRDGTSTYELESKRMPKRSLVKGESPAGTEAPSSGLLRTESHRTEPDVSPMPKNIGSQRSRPSSSRATPRNNTNRMVRATTRSNTNDTPGLTEAQISLFDEFARQTDDIEDPNEWMRKADELMERLAETSQVTEEEAELLEELGEELRDANDQEAPED